jgi:26S proteasome regulatory subunit N12
MQNLLAKDIETNVYNKHPVSLEQYLMKGSYNQVFLVKGKISIESYSFFINIALSYETGDETAGCIEKDEKVLFFHRDSLLQHTQKDGLCLDPNNYDSFAS